MTVVLQNEEQINKKIEQIENYAKKKYHDRRANCITRADSAKYMIAEKNFLFPTAMGLYVRATTKDSLRTTSARAFQLLSSLGFNPLKANKDLVSIDTYLRFLPFNYDFEFDKASLFRSRLCSLKQIASVFPVYGRTRGTGNPGYSAFNRQMEMVMFDIIGDRVNNAHVMTIGSTGSGKSANNIAILMQMMAMKFPRMVFIDAGASLRHMVNLWQLLGIKTNIIDIQLTRPQYSLNPFVNTQAMLTQVLEMERLHKTLQDYEIELDQKVQDVTRAATDDEKIDEFGERDYLIDFVAAAVLMITGANKKELEAITRQDRYFILKV